MVRSPDASNGAISPFSEANAEGFHPLYRNVTGEAVAARANSSGVLARMGAQRKKPEAEHTVGVKTTC
ncbi:hypothetical protein PCAR4_460175 [Paraburkholderia caribensis]|nr:hypothetical protein PCAR4_460175 [Paraburkholderia caribensis]